VFVTVAAVLLSRPGATRADVSLVSFDTADLPLRFVGAAEHYLKVNDACGVCGGDSKTCMGCDGVPNSPYRYDACGVCGDPASDAFNADCLDCAGVLHGASAVDDCGVCRDPADAAFSRAGVPDSHLGGCVGCDGIPNSGNELDACGVCAGLGCEPDDPTKRSWCCDCAETAFGTHVVDFCCACVDRASHWHALSGGAAEGPPAAHALAENLWRQGRDALAEQSAAAAAFRVARDESRARGVADGTVQPGDLTYARSFSLFELGERARAAFVEGWDIMRDFTKSDDMSRCYAETYVFGNRTNPRDACGVCGGDNATCAGCAGGVSVPDGGPRSGRLRFVRREPGEHRPVRRVLRGQPDLRRVRRRARVGQDVRRVPGEHGSAVPELPRASGRARLRVLGPGGVPRRLRRGRGRVLRVRRRAQLGRDPGRLRRVPGVGRPGLGQGGELHVLRVRRGSVFDVAPRLVLRLRRRGGRRVGVLRGRRGVRVVRDDTV
jgi:hypothetical protein